jgi:hypothetical protein
MPDHEHNGSSIPIPLPAMNELREAMEDVLHCDWFTDPDDRDAQRILERVAPKLYEVWAEARVEDVAGALARARGMSSRRRWSAAGFVVAARAALGLGGRS